MHDELEAAQRRLGRTLARARASEDRELAGRVRDEGAQLVHQLNGLLRTSRLHSLDNHAFDAPVRDSARSLARLAELLGTLTLAVVEDQVYLNEIRIRLDDSQGGGRELGAELARHGLGGLRFHRASSEAELRRLVACFSARPDPQAPRAALRASVSREGIEGVELLGHFRVRVSGEAARAETKDTVGALERSAQAVADAFDNLGRGRLFNPLPARRAVTELLAAGLERDPGQVEPDHLPPHVAHALRVCRLALRLGGEIGLSAGLLQDLGVAALLHDVGYADGSSGAGVPGGGATDLERHPAAGARLLLRQRGFHVSKVRRVRAVLGHHAPAARRRPPSLLARLLHVAEDYDTLLRRARLTPAEALARMAGAAGTLYDPTVLQAFVNVIGISAPAGPLPVDDVDLVLVDPSTPGPTADAAEPGVRPEAGPRVERVADVKPRSEPAPALTLAREGTVSQGVPIRLIHDAHLERRTGRLVLESDSERIALHFKDGEVVACSSSRPEHGLEALLVSGGLVAPAKIEWAHQESARTGHPPGWTLVSAGLVDATLLDQALAAQARTLVATVVEWEDGVYSFVPDEGPQAEEDEGHSISTDGLIIGAVRSLHDPDVVRFALGDLGRVLLRASDPARRLAAELVGPSETRLIEAVDDARTARQVLDACELPPVEARRALLTILSLGVVEYGAPEA
jgi:hypothetical protein